MKAMDPNELMDRDPWHLTESRLYNEVFSATIHKSMPAISFIKPSQRQLSFLAQNPVPLEPIASSSSLTGIKFPAGLVVLVSIVAAVVAISLISCIVYRIQARFSISTFTRTITKEECLEEEALASIDSLNIYFAVSSLIQ